MAGCRALDVLCGETGVGLGREVEKSMSAAELIAAAGIAMFGGQWKAGLARSLGVTDRSVNRWLGGTIEPRPGVFVDLLKVLQARHREIDALITAVERYLVKRNEP